MAAFPKQLIQAVLKKKKKQSHVIVNKGKITRTICSSKYFWTKLYPHAFRNTTAYTHWLFMRWDTKHMKMSGITIFMLFCIPVGVVVVCTYLYESSIVIILPVEVEIFDANTWRVSAGQQNRGAIHCFDWRHFTCGNFQSTNSPYA